jgi:hypothetical protein
VVLICCAALSIVHAQEEKPTVPQTPTADSDTDHSDADHRDPDHIKERNQWFFRGRIVRGKPSAELRRKAYQAKLQMRARHAAALAAQPRSSSTPGVSTVWSALGPVPLASDATGNGTQDYHQVSGRATAVAIDPADPTGNTVYVGGGQAGVWTSTNAALATANSVIWNQLTDDQATLSIGAIAIQPGNSNPAQSLILAATGEADNSADSYFGLGILRSNDAGSSWTLIPTANSGALSFSGLGGTQIAFNSARGQTNAVVAAMATTSEGMVDGAVTANTSRGLYTSRDAGQTWTYDALVDPGGATDATSATSVVYNTGAALFFAAVRYHGFYSSPDGVTWTRLPTQPGGLTLNTTACPPQSTSNNRACPIYRAEITAMSGRNEMYAWFISVSAGDSTVDGGIWQSLNGGVSWNSISETGITNCGDSEGCGAEQAAYNLELQAVPNGSGTDLYAGAINLYKCSINTQNLACAANPFLNLTHVYGCDPIAAPAHVHADQHALAYMIPNSGSDDGNALLYFANDGGIYRALDGYGGLTSGSCSGTNAFDDLNQNLGSMAQFVSFSQHPTDPNTLLGGTQDNGSPATNEVTTSTAWGNVLGGDGGYNAIDPNMPLNFYASNPDYPPGGLGIQLCSSGVNCIDSGFSFVATSSTVGGDDGAFYFPYILDPQSMTTLVLGTCRVWRGSRAGGLYTLLSPNFDTLGAGTCSGGEVNTVTALAAGGPTDSNGSEVIYATTSGLGPLDAAPPTGGRIWVTTNATAGIPSFADTTNNGPQGNINPNQFPISSVAIDPSDTTGSTAYVTIMGFTATVGSASGPGHVWKTTNAGASWTDFTANLPDSPVNAVVVDPVQPQVYVGTDVGVFASSTATANWTEVGPAAIPLAQPGYLPNVAVTALGIFYSGGQELLRASTYGRGMWQFGLAVTPTFQIAVSNPTLSIFSGSTNGAFAGTLNAVNGYASPVNLTCVPIGTASLPSPCVIPHSPLTPGADVPFNISVGGTPGEYTFNLQGVGADGTQVTQGPLTLLVVSFALTAPLPSNISVPRGTTSAPATFQVTAAGSFNQSVTVSCSVVIVNSVCALTPGTPGTPGTTTVNPTSTNPVLMTANITVPAGTAVGVYPVSIQATSSGAPAAVTATFNLTVTTNPTFVLSQTVAFPEVNAGSTGTTGPIAIASQDGFSGVVNLNCPATFGANSCSVSPTSVSAFPATATLTVNGSSFVAGAYALVINGTSGNVTNSVSVAVNVGDYSISGTQALSLPPGAQGTANFTLTSSHFYTGMVNASCDASALAGTICTLSPVSPLSVPSDGTASLSALIYVPNNAADGTYNVNINTNDTTLEPTHTFTLALTITQDFLLTSTTPSQTVNPGQTTGPYNLTVQPVGTAFNAPVTLTCANLPALSSCSFAPAAPVAPGTSAVNLVMTIATTAATSADSRWPANRPPIFYALWLLLPGLIISCVPGRRSVTRISKVFSSVSMLLLLMLTLSCGGISKGGGGGQLGTPPGTYPITVTGTSPGTVADAGQATQVTLVVN